MSGTASIRQRGDLGTDGETGSLFLRSDRRTTVIPWLRRYRRSDVYLIVAVLTGLAVVLVLVLAMVMEVGSWADERIARPYTEAELPHDPQQRAIALLKAYPVVDGHNDLPWQLREYFSNQLERVDLSLNSSGGKVEVYGDMWHTDIPRLQAGMVGAQFWSAWIVCESQYKNATKEFLEQVDVIHRLVEHYPGTFQFATSADDIESARKSGRIASLIGVEGGHAIDSSLATLRQFYRLGVRYMTLTHTCDTPWARSSVSPDPPGLSEFGKRVVREMNRLGMLVDISHVNDYAMMDTLDITLAPVIFSHSSAFALCNNTRNVPDVVLRMMPSNGGIVMVNFFPHFVSCTSEASVEQIADHVDYIRRVAGVDYIGVGSDFDGIPVVPVGLEDVSKYPNLFAELIRRGYSDEDVAKISRLNFLRVFRAVEKVRDKLTHLPPDNTLITPFTKTLWRP